MPTPARILPEHVPRDASGAILRICGSRRSPRTKQLRRHRRPRRPPPRRPPPRRPPSAHRHIQRGRPVAAHSYKQRSSVGGDTIASVASAKHSARRRAAQRSSSSTEPSTPIFRNEYLPLLHGCAPRCAAGRPARFRAGFAPICTTAAEVVTRVLEQRAAAERRNAQHLVPKRHRAFHVAQGAAALW